MNEEIFVKHMQIRGFKVLKTLQVYWVELSKYYYQAFPYHYLITPTQEELLEVFKNGPALALRFSAPPEYREGKKSFHIVANNSYNFTNLKRHVRYDIKRGLRECEINSLNFEYLSREGYALQISTLNRIKRIVVLSLNGKNAVRNGQQQKVVKPGALLLKGN